MASRWQQVVHDGLDVVELEGPSSSCRVALHGAQVVGFTPRGDRDRLWVSEKARWKVGTALRGGIPICFPWFGPHPTERGLPAHGFARTRIWRLVGVDESADGSPRAVLELRDDDQTWPLFPHRFTARTTVIAGEDLELSFEVSNDGDDPLTFEIALHAYLAVSDVGAISVDGLGGVGYVDKVAGGEHRRQESGPLRILGEVDRVYGSGGPVTLVDPGGARALHLETGGATSTIIWNPGPEKTRALGDMDPDGFRRFVCIETGNVGGDRVTLRSGGRQVLSVRYRYEDLGSQPRG